MKAFSTAIVLAVSACLVSAETLKGPVILNTLDFNTQVVENGVTKGTTPWFIKFYAPWCGHCKRMADDWGLFADKHRAAGDLNVGKIDCTADEGKAICQEFEVRGYPTLLFFPITPAKEGSTN